MKAVDLPIVVGVDGSEPSLRAVDWAADEAALRRAPLRLVYASLWERYEGALLAQELDKPLEEVMAQDVVGAARQRARRRQPGVKVTTGVLAAEPDYGLVRESCTALAMVLGCRGRGGIAEALLGSVSLAVAGHAQCPVIVLRGSHDNQARSGTRGRIVLGVGEKPAGSAAVRFATEEAALRGVPLAAVRAWRHPVHAATGHPLIVGDPARVEEQEAVEVLEEALRDTPAGLETQRRTVEGHARNVLVAASHEADLLVVGARRRHGHFGLQLGRVSHGVLHHAACPVAVVPELS
ncbi:universal stress protein [Streptomyces sp. Li-HN-5-11]|uniref:universal stress protein n=1 Tax=Streptomyces sp. Li-HN-5-11 TaxID=3075432 RepID=UPI0028AC9B27|nr:universal stress protein [Streptomyces sp. Li-HN-5-11]WNM32139.1 universal stress protein [Streptomyces sp. Li-HN-5-11]WOP39095.1 universal stress protein [Streptomyces sp. Li-HN-5-13]